MSALRLGTWGWERPEWGTQFYPSGMPPEWHLTYFNTQFGCVFVDQATWHAAGVDQLHAWVEDTHEQFVFLLEGAALEQVPAELAGRALILPAEAPAILWFDRKTDLKRLAKVLAVTETRPPFLLSRDADLGQIESVRTLLHLLGL